MKKIEEIERLAVEIKGFLVKNKLFHDIRMYFNNKYYDSKKGIIENINPEDYFKYSNPKTISMSFEGPFYNIINYYKDSNYCNVIIRDFNEILSEYGFYYELGNAWNLSLYEV